MTTARDLSPERDGAGTPPGCPVAGDGGTSPTGCPVSAQAAAFDPFVSPFQDDPAAALRWSRDGEPVFYSPKIGYWVVTRYDDVKAVFRDNRTFSPSIALEKITPTSDEANAVLARYGYAMSRTLVNEDEPAHTPRRRALMEPFTPPALAEHEPMVRRLTREYVDRIVDRGRADLVDEMLWEVPLTVALHFLGVPQEDMDIMREYSIAHTVNTWGRPRPEEQLTVAEAVGKFWQYAGTVLEKMRSDPEAPGWMPYGLRVQQERPDVVTDSYLHSMMMAGIVAAHETTANAAANAVRLLLEHRPVWEELCRDPSLIPNAVEECLRHAGSVASWRRLVTEDTTVGSVEVPAGARLLIVQSSANHDERHFENPDEVDVRRDNASDHLTFGYGSHQCMGKNLARMEIQVLLEELTTRLPHLELVPDQVFTYLPNTSFRGPDHVWVHWDPARNPERRDPSVLQRRQHVRLGEPSTRTVSRVVTVAARTPVADGVVELTLADPDGRPLPRWSPGSHIDVDCGELSRQYSLCGDPEAVDRYSIAVLDEPASRGGSRFLHERAQVGERLRIRGPRNHFALDPDAAHCLLVAGGIGITPIVAMADRLRADGRSYELHYAGRDLGTMAFIERLQAAHGDRLTLHSTSSGRRLDLSRLLARPAAGTQVYACGPQRMLDGLAAALADWPEDTLHVEHFSSTLGALDPEQEHAFDVELRDSGITVRVERDQTVLQALRAANVDVESDCEEGLCGACEVPVVAGEVEHRDVVLNKSERASSRVMMSCCSRACGDRLVLGL